MKRLFPLFLAILVWGMSPWLRAAEPVVTMLVPGFTVEEVPLPLSNINNLRFGQDGRLYALGYDGRIHVLSDTNHDGRMDKATLFWDKPTLAIPVGLAWTKEGLYVSSQGKVSLIRDSDGDGRGDREEIVAQGWTSTDVQSGGVDATAVTVDRSGNVYFGLITADYSNPYRIKDTISRYDLNGKRGTIQKLSADGKSLTTLATGLRVPYALAFNRYGDLFGTDQEGETWCPGGNPLDEFNHIIPGRNYGFPPRHPLYLPDLISEPPVVGFGPQHQSACGFVFNERPFVGSRLFGPESWEGDAIVAGQSRGKLWRVRLVKTAAGYVGKVFYLASLRMLTTDVAISPVRGDLYVSCHSGAPDWGSGPSGEGKLFRISYTDPSTAQPVATWVDSTLKQVSVAFDRPLAPELTNRLAHLAIDMGEHVRPADRLELLKPSYQSVELQARAPWLQLPVQQVSLSADRKILTLQTEQPHRRAVHYAVSLPDLFSPQQIQPPSTVEVGYTLNGVDVSWIGADRQMRRSQLPHADLDAARGLLGPELFQQRLAGATGPLLLATQLQLPLGLYTFYFRSDVLVEAGLGTNNPSALIRTNGTNLLAVSITSTNTHPLLRIALAPRRAGQAHPALQLAYSSATDPVVRPIPCEAFLMPGIFSSGPMGPRYRVEADLAGGDYKRGQDLFFGTQLRCGTCHPMRGQGGAVGPDLGNLAQRDAASVLRDIREPSATIHPDYHASVVVLQDGEELTGFRRSQNGQSIRLVGGDGVEQVIERPRIRRVQPSRVSLMPEGLLDGLESGQVKDLMTYLLFEPPHHTVAEAQAIMRAAGQEPRLPAELQPLQIVWVAGQPDHGPGEHDYLVCQKLWASVFAQARNVSFTNALTWPTQRQFDSADLLVFYYWNRDWSAEKYRQLDEFLARGRGVVMLHSAVIEDKFPERLAQRIGLAAQPSVSKYLHGPMDLKLAGSATNNAILRGFSNLQLLDEPYWPLIGNTNQVEVLATAEQEGRQWPMIWTCRPSQGRVFASIPGHYTWTHEDPLFRLLILRGMAWAASQPVQRFDALVGREEHTLE